MTSVYKSSTGVTVPLSFTGKHALQNLREAMVEAMDKNYKDGLADGKQETRRFRTSGEVWEPLSKARLAIAQYMSKLEQRNGFDYDTDYSAPKPHYLEVLEVARDDQLQQVLRGRGFYVSPGKKPPFATGIIAAIPDGHIRQEYARRGMHGEGLPAGVTYGLEHGAPLRKDQRTPFVESALQKMIGMPVPITLKVHGDITKVSTADLLKELEKRGALPKAPVTQVLPAIPTGYVLEQVGNLTIIKPHASLEATLARINQEIKTDEVQMKKPNISSLHGTFKRAKKATKRKAKAKGRHK